MKHPFFFDYIWYRIYAYYKTKNDNTAKLTASITMSVGPMTNILSILFPLNYLFKEIFILNEIIILCLAFSILILNILRYNTKKISNLIDNWENELPSQKRSRGFLVVFYLIFSLAVMIGIAGYLGSLRNR